MAWTTEQEAAIKFRNGNLLVSAAAGSGKTAVLIERILQRILDEKDPLSIDQLVVVTFTNAAAEQMKSKLSAALEIAVSENPDNRHLLRQLSLIDSARISTIDSFCQYIVRNYYNSIDLDPSFRVADQGELKLVMNDVLEEIIEKKFENNDKSFIDFVENFASKKSLDNIYNIVFDLYNFSESNPWPAEWFLICKQAYTVKSVSDYEGLSLVKFISVYAGECVKSCIEDYRRMLIICSENSGFSQYAELFAEEKERLEKAADKEKLADILKAIPNSYDRLPKATNVDDYVKKLLQNMRNDIKDRLAKLLKMFPSDMELQFKQMEICLPMVNELINLTMEFSEAYHRAKKEKNIMDFSDIEHCALDILIDNADVSVKYSRVADELACRYREIYIDEYQDSNYVQEEIMKAVSTERFGKPDIFMVGDIKQSIYRFRMAKPEIFLEKYNTYGSSGEYTKIELHKNFRSRKNVLDTINDIFFMAMHSAVGKIEYTDKTALNSKGGEEPEMDDRTRIVIADSAEFEDIDNRELQAHMVAREIEKILSENKDAHYRDITILLRSVSAKAPVYSKILESHGIPCVFEKTKGYFETSEIQCVLNFLRVIDNPLQEIPLAGLMRSFFSYFTADELAMIKGRTRKTQLYDCVINTSCKDSELGIKCRDFVNLIQKYRSLAKTASVSELVTDIIYSTGYYDYTGSLRGGVNKKANLEMLICKAREYEHTSYVGLFNFIRYIEKLKKFELDIGEKQLESEEDDVVKIMSIHKSKGLEFKYVILGESSSKMNMKDVSGNIIYDDNYGIALRPVDLDMRARLRIAYRDMLGIKMTCDTVGEEIRLLYVALTRAVDKLIIVGVANVENKMPLWQDMALRDSLNMNYILENTNYLDIIMPAALKTVKTGSFDREIVDFKTMYDYIGDSVRLRQECFIKKLEAFDKTTVCETEYREIADKLEYEYPYSHFAGLANKYSVSDLKHMSIEELEDDSQKVVPPEAVRLVPSFAESEGNKDRIRGGINRGNAYHKVFELLDYKRASDGKAVVKQVLEWTNEGIISEEYAKYIKAVRFDKFLNSELGRDMKEAAEKGVLFREKPFMMRVDSQRVDKYMPAGEYVLIQGIVDAFYFKDDKVYIVDYKTDHVDMETGEECLINRYATQLMLYCDAISSITGKKIGGCYIYSLSLDCRIEIPVS